MSEPLRTTEVEEALPGAVEDGRAPAAPRVAEAAPGDAAPDDVFAAVEHELTVLLRRARGASKDFARQVHPDLESDAYGLLIRLEQVGGARGTDLASFFGIGKPTISRQVKMLEELGLVERQAQEGDARASVLVLTEEGKERFRRMREDRRSYFRELLTDWDESSVEQFAGLLHRWNITVEER